MLETEPTVMVYEFEFWDPDAQSMVRSRTPATLDAIRNGLGVPVISTGRRVSLSRINSQGRVRAP